MSRTKISIQEAVTQLVEGIMEYESDTFPGGVTEQEARGMAAIMIVDRAEELGYSIDGVMLSEWLEEYREGQE